MGSGCLLPSVARALPGRCPALPAVFFGALPEALPKGLATPWQRPFRSGLERSPHRFVWSLAGAARQPGIGHGEGRRTRHWAFGSQPMRCDVVAVRQAGPHAMVCRLPRWVHAIVCDACNRVGPSYPCMQPRALREPFTALAPENFFHFRFVFAGHAGIFLTTAGARRAVPVSRRC